MSDEIRRRKTDESESSASQFGEEEIAQPSNATTKGRIQFRDELANADSARQFETWQTMWTKGGGGGGGGGSSGEVGGEGDSGGGIPLNPHFALFAILIALSLFVSFRIYAIADDDEVSRVGRGRGGRGGDDDAKKLHAVVFDAGSTGTRIHVFQFVRRNSIRFDDVEDISDKGEKSEKNDNTDPPNDDFTLDLVHEVFDHVEPGLSAYADDPLRCLPGLQRLLRVALEDIPASELSSTPVIFKATAGLRLLTADKAETLLNLVRKVLEESGFRVENEDVSILDGIDEGYYGWITVNYLLDRFGGGGGGGEAAKEKVATMDLGGGSTQITFDLPSDDDDANGDDLQREYVNNNNNNGVDLPREFVKTVEILGEEARIYARSYLGLGIMAARLAILRKGTLSSEGETEDDANNNVRDLVSPCLPPWHEDVWTYGGVEYRVKASSSSSSSSAWTTCFSLASAVVASAAVDKIPRRIVDDRRLYAFSYYFDRLLEVGLISASGGDVLVEEIVDAASRVCRHFPRDKRPFLCCDLAQIAALLTSGFGFQGEDRIFLRKKIAGKEASWSLGSAFSLIDGR